MKTTEKNISGATLASPRSLAELFALLANEADKNAPAVMVAGATDWIPQRGRAHSIAGTIVDLSGIGEMRGIARAGDVIRVGAMTTMTDVAENRMLQTHAPALCEAARRVGSWQIRNRATVGGNVANASPAADTPPALAALGATALVGSARVTRKIPVSEMTVEPGVRRESAKNFPAVLSRDEAIVAFEIPVVEGATSAFVKVGSRAEVSISRVNLAARIVCAADGMDFAAQSASVFIGTLGSFARRAEAAEAVLLQSGLSEPERAEKFIAALCAVAEAAIPGRATLPYKKSALRGLGEDLLASLRAKQVNRLKEAKAEGMLESLQPTIAAPGTQGVKETEGMA